jgi:hypothetical protein
MACGTKLRVTNRTLSYIQKQSTHLSFDQDMTRNIPANEILFVRYSWIGFLMTPSTELLRKKISRSDAVNDLDETESSGSAVSWGAIVAGAFAAASLSLILLILGVGLGLSSVSPWSAEGLRAGTFGVSTIAWLTLTQLLASALGGYLAGRLRTRWNGVHRDEVYFRDTAHGFLAWAVASLATAAMLTSAIGAILGNGVQAGAALAGSASAMVGESANARVRPTTDGAQMGYFIDAMFRRDLAATTSPATGSPADITSRVSTSELAEASRIFAHTNRSQPLAPEDQRYVGQMVAQHTGLSQQDAEKRVAETYAREQAAVNEAVSSAKEIADKVRKASAYGALWLFISLLIGAFFASLAATFGGYQRDH